VTQVDTRQWSSSAPTGYEPKAELALLARILHREGYDDHLAGHISYKQADGTFLVNPAELTWDEVTASDVMRIDIDGKILEGRWSVTPAIVLHTELHRARDDITVAVHNHPRWGTIWADMQRVPPAYDQTSALLGGDLVLYDTYGDNAASVEEVRKIVAVMGQAPWALLANHGVFVTGNSIREAHLRAVTLEWRCRQAWHVAAAGGGAPMPREAAAQLDSMVSQFGFPGLFEAMARKELRVEPPPVC
jgi:L-fuculose-phosphate aldolase